MKNKKLKEPHTSPEIEIIIFELSDIVTASSGETWKPGDENYDPNAWT